jgi:hypothetical protein
MELSHGTPLTTPLYSYEIGLALPPDGAASRVIDEGPGNEDPADDDEAGPLVPAGRHSLAKGEAIPQPRTSSGHDPVEALASGLGDQIRTLTQRLGRQLSQNLTPETEPKPDRNGFTVETVSLTFGITAKASAGNVLSVLVALSGETNIEVTLTLKRQHTAEPGSDQQP